ncbi:MAG TPA: hypothetical protein VLY04_19655 [Bryobacteraceae bacterium]|nr:hypothetical protein [Bryobacteraceae bacterium]
MRSPAGGWVVTAVMRQKDGREPVAGSTAADSIVVFGNDTDVKLSHVRTGWPLATPANPNAIITGHAILQVRPGFRSLGAATVRERRGSHAR